MLPFFKIGEMRDFCQELILEWELKMNENRDTNVVKSFSLEKYNISLRILSGPHALLHLRELITSSTSWVVIGEFSMSHISSSWTYTQ